MSVTIAHCRAGRALLGWTINDLAAAAGVGVMTIHRFEGGQKVAAASLDKVENALCEAGVIILASGAPSLDGGDGVRLVRRLGDTAGPVTGGPSTSERSDAPA